MKHLIRYFPLLLFYYIGTTWAQAPSVTVLTPNGGEVWSGATTQNITWTSVNISNVVLEYSTNAGSNWINITTWPASAQTYAWVVPGAGPLGSNQCLVRIYDALNTAVVDQSNNFFSIPPSSITLLQPNGGEQWPVGSLQSIVWTHNSILNIDIEYSTNNGTNWTTIATGIPALRGFHNWTIPATVSSNCIVRVKDAANPTTVNDMSNAVFSIIAALTVDVIKYRGGSFDGFSLCQNVLPSVTVLTPNGGETWPGATTQNITWSYTNIPNNVLIEISYNNGSSWTSLTTWPASAQTFPWVVSGPGSTQCLVRVSDAQNSTINDVSNSNFTIPTATISVVQPNGGEQWPVGSLQSIVWNSQSVNNVNLDYSTNNGSSWVSIATNQTAQRGFFNWTIPATVSGNCLVRATDASNSLVTDNSNAVFSIITALTVDVIKYRGGSFDGFTLCTNQTPSITVLTPNGGEIWSGATTQNITWSYTNISNNVLIEYSTNNGTSWNTITTWPVTAGTYPWMVPGAGPLGSTQCLVRVSDAQNNTITDQSNSTFTIPGSSVTVLQPNGGEQWPVGSLQSIVWNVQSVLTVNIEYSTNNGSSWTSIATNFNSSIGFFNWIIPANVSTTCLVRVSDFANTTTVNDVSNSVFSIIGALTVDVNKYRGGSYDGFTSCYTGCVPPTANMTGAQTICAGSQAVLTVNFTGSGPYVITYTNGTTPVTQSGITANPYLLTLTPTVTTSYSLTALSNTCVNGPVTGAALVTLTSGPSATLAGNQTICIGNPAPLTITLTGASPWSVTWTDGTTPSTQTGLTASPFILNPSPSVNTTYSLVSVSSPSCTGGVVSGTAAIQVNAAPVAALSGGGTLCSGNTATITFNLTGTAPWNLVWTDGTSNTTQLGITSSPYIATVTIGQSVTYSMVSVTNACGTGTSSGTAAFLLNTPPVATLTGTQTICVGGSALLSVSITGTAPWNLTWTNGTTPQSQTGITSSPYIISVTPSAVTTYGLVSVSGNCSGTVSGTAIITPQSGPTATLSGTQTICGAGTAQVTIALTGSAPWSVTFTDGTTPSVLNGVTANPLLLTVSPSSSTTYSVTAVSTSGCPSGAVSGMAAITRSTVPTATLTGNQTICTGFSAQLTVSLTGGAPYQLVWTDGTTPQTQTGLTGTSWLINLTPSVSTTYSLVSITNACTGTVSGTAAVTVFSPPSATLSGNQTICGTAPAQLTIIFSGPSPWNVTWTDGTTPVAVNGITSSPYTFTVTPVGVTTYNLVSVTNSFCNTGAVSGQAIVNQMPMPTASISGTQSLCNGQSGQLTVVLTGTAPWNFVWTDGTNVNTVMGHTASVYIVSVTPTSTRTYTLNSVSDACGTGTVSGSAVLTVVQPPLATLTGTQTICVGSGATLSVVLTGTGPWSLTWTNGVTPVTQTGITASPYTWSVSPVIQTTYSLTSVSNGCAGTTSGSAIVSPVAVPTASISGSQTVCPSQAAQLSVALTGVAPWNITWTNGTTPVTVTGINTSPYTFSVTSTTSNTYSLTSVGSAGCSPGTLSGNAVITILPLPTAAISGNNSICSGQSTQFSVALTGNSPWSFSYSDGTTINSVISTTQNPYWISVTPAGSRTYTLTSLTNACGSGTVSGQATVQVTNVVSATLSGSQTICSGNSGTISASLVGNAPWNLTWTDGVASYPVTGITATPFVFSVSPTATSTFVVLNVNSGGCIGNAFGSHVVSVIPGPSLVMSGGQNVCSGVGVAMNFTLGGSPPWNITFTNGTNTFTQNGITSSPYVLNFTPAVSVTYTPITVSNACGSGTVAGSAIYQVTPVSSAVISGTHSICPGSGAAISVNLTGTGPWSFTYSNGFSTTPVTNVTASPWVLNVSPTVSTTYTLVNLISQGCSGTRSGAAVISLINTASANLSGSQTICAGTQATLTTILSGSGPWNLTWTDGTANFTQTGITASPYLITVTPTLATTYSLVAISAQGCIGTVSGNAVVQIQSGPTASIAGNQTICPGGSAQFSISMTGTGPWDLTWLAGTTPITQTGITANPWVVSVSPAVTTTYKLTSVSDPNCPGGAITGSGQIVVQLAPAPSPAVVQSNQSICTTSATLSANTPTAGTGQWTVTSGTSTILNSGNPNTTAVSLSQGINSYVWTVSLGSCSSAAQLDIYREIPPVASNAGQSQVICGSSTVLAGNTATNNGTGTWTIVSGSCVIANPNSPTSAVSSIQPGVTVLRWTISNGVCPATQDTMTITSALGVTNANAGADQTICVGSANLNANMANPGQGFWTVVSGGGAVTNSFSNSTQITGLTVGTSVLVWTLANAGCVSSDTVRITRITAPVANFTFVQSGTQFTFTDLSQNPVSWYWTFGDGNNSNLQNPQHTYQQSGVYTVTLIIANGCGSDTFNLQVNNWGVSAESLVEVSASMVVYPNPASDRVEVRVKAASSEELRLRVLDVAGHEVMVSGKVVFNSEGIKWELNTSGLAAGTYFLEINGTEFRGRDKLIILR